MKSITRTRKMCAVFLLLLPLWGYAASAPLLPVNLKVEYLDNPLGLDRPQPRFSWTLKSTRPGLYGQKQTAYRVLVASSLKKLNAGIGDIWDSEWERSAQMSQVVLPGARLHSDRRYYWKVAVKDETNAVSDWSATAYWHTGMLEPGAWKAGWIGSSVIFDPAQKDCNIPDPWLRKVFALDAIPAQAMLYVASVGFHELYVNGKRVGDDVMPTAVTDHTKRARYLAYDIAPYLNKGANAIAIWLGTSWSIHGPYVTKDRPNTPIVAAQVDCYAHKDPGPAERPFATVRTDASWKVKGSPNKLLGVWNSNRMGGELWDANLDEPLWNTIAYRDANWLAATVYHPGLQVSAQQVEQNRRFDEIRPVSIKKISDDTYRVDMGVNFAGWIAAKLEGQPGHRAELLFSERENMEMTFGLHSAYIFDKTGKGTFRNKFNYGSGRWITIKGVTKTPQLGDIKGWLVRTAYKDAASFSCSDSLQNWIYNTVRWTYENLSLGGFIVDCPQRERLGYGGDAHATCETGMLNYQVAAMYTKWMEDWRDVSGTESIVGNMYDTAFARKAVMSGRHLHQGILPHTAPTYMGGGGPAWGGIVVTLPWYFYRQYGDESMLRNNFTLIRNWLDFLERNTRDGILQRFGGKWDFLGDWLWPNATAEGMNNDSPQNLCFNNLYRIYNLRTAIKIADQIGEKEWAGKWREQAAAFSDVIHKKFFNEADTSYADGSMGNLVAALLAEVVPDAYKQKVWKRLEHEIRVRRKGHIHVGITGGALLFKLLREQNRQDLLLEMTSKTDYPGWGYMKANGATTIWEMWEKDLPGHSLLHSSFLYPGAWYIDGLAGIKVDKPGYERFVIQPPQIAASKLGWVKAGFESPAGFIKSNWSRRNGVLHMELEIPPNTTALLKIADTDGLILKEKKNQVRLLGKQGNITVYELQSGVYRF
ncbi:glycoside hydrolase family 78 protein [Niabella sp. CC-SYL272]|uniref:family 78 glycoside hydrolase catalytic domain n=1 Tax=Niabella agricola TaxID=2891571 RepID=UPI001F34209C|nr:family 78 glycoside hydrolase catalytic domain [Niabella agricola]MCF3110231.1 glycoside hydrolase family 78 protein [Niabella agricola]